jgi:histidinol-phosphate aminotransferase
VYGMAGARVGYAVGHARTIEQMSAILCWPNGGLGRVSLAGAIASLEDRSFFEASIARNEQARNFTMKELRSRNLAVIPSHTNFLYFSLVNYPGDYFQKIKAQEIVGTGIYEERGRWTRITIGTMDDMTRFVSAL